MKYFRSNRRRFYRRRRGSKAVKFWKKRVPRPIRKYVKAVIHRNVENKEYATYGANISITSGDSVTGTYPIIGTVAQGTAENQRIGNQIRCVKGQIKASVNLMPYNALSNPNPLPVLVKMWLVRDLKQQGQLSTLLTGMYNNFFRAGATAYSFNGNPLDIVSEVNKDLFRVLATRTFRLGCTGSITATPIAGASYLDNSPMSKQITFNWGKYVKKQLKYDESSSNCSNSNVYLVIQAVNADGTASNGKTMIEWHYTNIMHFEDA